MRLQMKWLFTVLLLIGVLPLVAGAADKKQGLAKPEQTVSFSRKMLQGYNMRVWLSNKMTMGLQAWDVGVGTSIPLDPHLGLEYPFGTPNEHLYGAGPWIGGKVKGVIHVDEGYNGDDARNELCPEIRHIKHEHFWRTAKGASATGERDSIGYSGFYYNNHRVVDQRGCDNDGDGKINEDDLDGFDNDGDWNPYTDDVGEDGLPDSLEASCNGVKYDPVLNPDPFQDNYSPNNLDLCRAPDASGNRYYKNDKDYYTEHNGLADHGEPHVDEDYGAISDNDLYCSATDTFKIPVVTGHVPMHVKVVQKSYAWKGSYADAILPFEYYFINAGKDTINNVYVGFFMDIDLGPVNIPNYYQHDYSAYFDSLRTAYIHNPVDRGSTPLGLTVLKTPRALDSLDYIFQWFDFTTQLGPGSNDSLIYLWMKGDLPGGPHIHPDQPTTALSDTRFMFSFGDFPSFKPGDTLKIAVAFVSGLTVGEGPSNLKENAQKALKLYSRGFVQPVTPTSPKFAVTQGFKSVHLNWHQSPDAFFQSLAWDDSNKKAESYPPTHWRRINPPCNTVGGGCTGHQCVNGYLPGGRIFSGYKIYRSEDPSATPDLTSFALLKEITLSDNATYDDLLKFNDDSTSYVDTNLVRGKRYWYSVTTFGIPDITLIPVVDPNTNAVRYDTLFSSNSESALNDQMHSVDLRFAADTVHQSVLVVPNPYRVDREYTSENGGWEGRGINWDESKRMIRFIHLPKKCTIRIFTLAGDQVAEAQYNSSDLASQVGDPQVEQTGQYDFPLLSESNRALASGIYIFTVESSLGTQIGKFVIIR
jgi:hypothetical protein